MSTTVRASYGSQSGSAALGIATPWSIVLSLPNTTVPFNGTQTYTVTALLGSGETQDVTNLASFYRDTVNITTGDVSLQSPGLIKGIQKGFIQIWVLYNPYPSDIYYPIGIYNPIRSNAVGILIQ